MDLPLDYLGLKLVTKETDQSLELCGEFIWASCFQCHGNVALIKFGNSCSFRGLYALSFTLIWNGLFIIDLQWSDILWLLVILLWKCSNNTVVKHTWYAFVTPIVRILNWFYTKYQTISHTVIWIHQQDCFMTRQIMCMMTGSFPCDLKNKYNLVGSLTWMIYVLFILYFQVWSIKERKGGLQSALKPGLPHTITD